MKRSLLALAAATSAGVLTWPHLAYGQTPTWFTWNPTGASTGPVDGAGTWDTTNARWWNGTNNIAWSNLTSDGAYFGAGGTGGAVTIQSTGVNVGGLAINSPGYTIGGGTLSVTGAASFNINQTGTITSVIGGTGSITYNVASGATLLLSGTAVNTYTGGSTINAGGTINLGATATLGTGSVILNGGLFRFNDARTISNTINLPAGQTGTVFMAGNGTLSGALSGTGTLVFDAASAGRTFSLQGNNGTFAGTVKVVNSAGILRFTNAAGGSAGATFDLTNTGVTAARLATATVSLGAVVGQPGSVLGGSSSNDGLLTYDVGSLNTDTTFNGVIANGSSSARRTAIRKVGTATWTLGGSNTHTGNTTIDGGTLALAAGASLNSTAVVAVNNGAAFNVTALAGGYTIPAGQTISGNGGTVYGNVTLGGSGTVNPGSGTGVGTAGTLNFANTFATAGGTITLDLSNTTTVGGGVNDLVNFNALDLSAPSKFFITPIGTFTTGTYRLANYNSMTGSLSNLSAVFGARVNATLDTSTPGQINLNVTGTPAALPLRWAGPGTEWDVSTSPNFIDPGNAATAFFNSDGVTFDDTAGAPTTVNLNTLVQPGSLNFSANTANYTITGTGTIGGSTGLNKTGAAAVTINTANAFTGGVNVSAGTLTIGSSAGVGTNAVNLNGAAAFMLGGGITVGNTVNVNADGATIGGNGTFTGGITLVPSTVNVSIPTGATVSISGATNFLPFGITTLNFGSSAGTFRFTAANASTGNLVFDLGSASASMINRDGNATFTIGGLAGGANTSLRGASNTATLSTYTIGGNDVTTTFNGSIANGAAGAGAVVNIIKAPIGTLILNGNSTYTGTTRVNGSGTLIVNGTHVGAGTYLVDSGAALGGSGNVSGTLSVAGTGIVMPGAGLGAVGTLRVGHLALDGAQLPFDIGGGDADAIVSTSGTVPTLANTSSISIANAGGGTFGRYALIDYGGATALPNLANLNLTTTNVAGVTASLANNTLNTSVDLLVPNPAAVSGQWNVNGGGDWPTSGNWTGGNAPNGADHVATFGTVLAGGVATINLTSGRTVAFANFDSSAGSYALAGPGALTLDASGGYVGVNVFSGGHSIGAPVTLGKNGVFAVNTGGTLTIDGAISGTGRSVTKSGGGVLNLSAVNTYSGRTDITAGTLAAASTDALGDGGTGNQLMFSGGALRATGDVNSPATRGVFVHPAGGTVDSNANTVTLGGAIGGAGALTKTGAGTLVLPGNNTYLGGTNVNAGVLRVANTAGSATGSGTVNVAAGATLMGAGTIAGRAVLATGANLNPGVGVGTLGVASLTLNAASLNFDIDSSGADRVNVTASGGLTLSGVSTLGLTDLGGAGAGTYTVLDYAGTALADLSAFSLGTTTLGSFTLSLSNNTANTSVDLVLTAAGATNANWNVDADGNWSVAGNWSPGAPNAAGAIANFGPVINAPRTVTVDAPQTTAQVNFNNANKYTIAGASTLTLDNTAGGVAINVSNGSHDVTAPLVLAKDATISVTPAASVLTLSNLQPSSVGVTKAGAGQLAVNNVRAGSLTINAGSVSVLAGRSTARTSKVTSLSIAAGALDLNDQDLIVDYTGGSPLSTIKSLIVSGYNSGSWNGSGFRSSSALSGFNGHATALGYAEASAVGIGAGGGTFSGQSVDNSSVLVRYTLRGDGDLSGNVDLTDFTFLAANFNGSGKSWQQGDYNYDGNVDLTDFTFLAGNFNQTLPSAPAGAPSLGGLVPEPATLATFGLMAAGLLARRRRRHRTQYTGR